MAKREQRRKLTKSLVDGFELPAGATSGAGKPILQAFLWDGETRGFGVRVTADGTKSFVVQGRIKGGAGGDIRMKIGSVGTETVEQARELARDHLRDMRQGIDPRAKLKRNQTLGITLREVADGYKRDRPLKESSKAEIERHVTTTFEAWEHKPLKSISRPMVTERFNCIRDHGLRGKKGSPGQANQAFSVLRALFNYAIREYREPDGAAIFTDNPCDVLYKKFVTLQPKSSLIPTEKVGDVWNALLGWREEQSDPHTLMGIDFVMFLMLTGARTGEAQALTWDRVNFEDAWWHLPDPKNRNPVWLPLSTQAIDVLRAREKHKRANSPYVFPSWSKSGHIRSPRDRMNKISEIAGLHLSVHDLRRTFTQIGIAQCQIEFSKIELLTNHVPKGITARHYLQTQRLQWLRPQAQQIADWITEQARTAAAVAASKNVVPLRA